MHILLKNNFSKFFGILMMSCLSIGSAIAIDTEDGYVGAQACIECHEEEYKAWRGSNHDMSMRHATIESVKGNFNNQILIDKDKEYRFFMKGEQYWVNIEGPDGKFHDYQIKYTFATEPLQQYMVEFEDGRVQLIPFAWGAKENDPAGPKWFYLYPEFEPHDEWYWTNPGQNWNYMCADCHSTNLKKNYDLETNTYDTSFSEINVSCEACHGPAEEHMKWSLMKDSSVKLAGFDREMGKSVSDWVLKQGAKTLTPKSIEHSQQTLVCAQCHSRRNQISDSDHVRSNEYLDRHLLESISPELYYPDGQIYDEDFVYGSFIQSEMARNGVVCSNCHDPHKAELAIPKEAVCLQCHLPTNYATEEHHHHKQGSTGAQCTNCHMTETTYMKVDDRADHAWHSPRPDLGAITNAPDACTSCHDDKDRQWSIKHSKKWYGEQHDNVREFAKVFAQPNDPGYPSSLAEIANNSKYADIIRASALERMQGLHNEKTVSALTKAVSDKDSHVRLGVINGSIGLSGDEQWNILSPLLIDNVLAVRVQAAQVLSAQWGQLTAEQKHLFEPALADFIKTQEFNNDKGYAHTNIGMILSNKGLLEEAEQAYQQSIRIEPTFVRAYVNLADLHRIKGNDKKTVEILQLGLKNVPDAGVIAYSLGLAHFRMQQKTQASESFKAATEFEPLNPNFLYVYALSIQEAQPKIASKALRKAYKISGNPQYLFSLCSLLVDTKSFEAKQCISQLSGQVPPHYIISLKNKLSHE